MIASHTQTALHTWQSVQTLILHIRSYWLLIIAMKKARENVLQVISRGIKCHFQDIQILTGRTRTRSSKVYGLFTPLNDFQKPICSASHLLRASKFSSLDYFHCFVFRRFWWQDCLKFGGKWVTWRGHLLSNALQTQPSRYILILLLPWSSLWYPLVFSGDPVTCHSAWMLLEVNTHSLLRPSHVLPSVAQRLHLLVREVMQLFLFLFILYSFIYLAIPFVLAYHLEEIHLATACLYFLFMGEPDSARDSEGIRMAMKFTWGICWAEWTIETLVWPFSFIDICIHWDTFDCK